jgi:hypothetical protein
MFSGVQDRITPSGGLAESRSVAPAAPVEVGGDDSLPDRRPTRVVALAAPGGRPVITPSGDVAVLAGLSAGGSGRWRRPGPRPPVGPQPRLGPQPPVGPPPPVGCLWPAGPPPPVGPLPRLGPQPPVGPPPRVGPQPPVGPLPRVGPSPVGLPLGRWGVEAGAT